MIAQSIMVKMGDRLVTMSTWHVLEDSCPSAAIRTIADAIQSVRSYCPPAGISIAQANQLMAQAVSAVRALHELPEAVDGSISIADGLVVVRLDVRPLEVHTPAAAAR